MKFFDLTQIALLGTERQNLAVPASSSALAQVQARVDLKQRERALLSLAALADLHERIGALPPRWAGAPPPRSPPEQRPRAGALAGSLLVRMLGGEHVHLLPEWLRLAHRSDWLAPPETLPGLLGLGSSKPELRAPIVSVLGERGHWLAAQNAEWSWAVGATTLDENLWHTGDRSVRLNFLQQLRRTQPARARELLAATWKNEEPDDRAAFLLTLTEGLSADDEPWLEAALDDKRKEVRREAASLLSKLPGSAFVRRMIERLRPLLTFTPARTGSGLRLKKTKPAAIEVTLPDGCDKAMQRDGIDLKPRQGIGEKAWWLMQMLEAVPLDFWTREWNCAAVEIIQASDETEWAKELFHAWASGAIRQQNSHWAEVLFVAAIERKRFDWLLNLFTALRPEQREAQLAAMLEANDKKVRDLHGSLLDACKHDWSAGFSRAALAYLKREAALPSGDWSLRNHLREFAGYLAPEILAEAARGWPTESADWEFWSKGVDEFLAVVQFRTDLHNAFQQRQP
ncbi:MAG: DUF5691 domain-containing protein [Verrucomicrobiota bacterium]